MSLHTLFFTKYESFKLWEEGCLLTSFYPYLVNQFGIPSQNSSKLTIISMIQNKIRDLLLYNAKFFQVATFSSFFYHVYLFGSTWAVLLSLWSTHVASISFAWIIWFIWHLYSLTLFLPAFVTWYSYMGWFCPVPVGIGLTLKNLEAQSNSSCWPSA